VQFIRADVCSLFILYAIRLLVLFTDHYVYITVLDYYMNCGTNTFADPVWIRIQSLWTTSDLNILDLMLSCVVQ